LEEGDGVIGARLSAGLAQQAGVEQVLASHPLQQQPDFGALIPEAAEVVKPPGHATKNDSRSMTAALT